MSEYVGEYVVSLTPKTFTDLRFHRHEEIVRCRDCGHATISSLGHVKYCKMFVLPDDDGYGADPQVCLPLDFFCAYGKPKADAHAERLHGEGVLE